MLEKIFINLTTYPKAYAHLQCKNVSQLMTRNSRLVVNIIILGLSYKNLSSSRMASNKEKKKAERPLIKR